MSRTLWDMLQEDARAWKDASLPVEAYRAVLAGAAEVFTEESIREALPLDITNLGFGAIQSRAMKVLAMGAAQHGMKGTGGNIDQASYGMDDQPFYPVWQNWEVPRREQDASALNSALGLDLFRDSGRLAAQLVVEGENALLVSGLGPITGFTKASGIQTFAGGSWATQGNAWKDAIKARGKIKKKKVPIKQLALMLNQDDETNLLQTFSNTSDVQLDKLKMIFPGGIYSNTNVASGKAYVYAKTAPVLQARVGQDLTTIPLPRTDEDDRGRVRVTTTLHVRRPEGICEITGIT